MACTQNNNLSKTKVNENIWTINFKERINYDKSHKKKPHQLVKLASSLKLVTNQGKIDHSTEGYTFTYSARIMMRMSTISFIE